MDTHESYEKGEGKYQKAYDYLSGNHQLYLSPYELEQLHDRCLRQQAASEHIGYRHERVKHNPREKAFSDEWIKTNRPMYGVNFGHGTLQDLFMNNTSGGFSMLNAECVEEINSRDRMIVATVIQWLGSNVGMSFLHSALDRVGMTIISKKELGEK